MVIVFKMKGLIMSNFGKTPMPSLLKSVSCVTFFSESLEPIFIFPRPLDEQEYWKTWMPLKILCFGRKKEPEEIDKQKNTLSERAEGYFFYQRSCRSEASRRKWESSKIWSQHSIERKMKYSWTRVRWSPFMSLLLNALLERLDMLSGWPLSAKRV